MARQPGSRRTDDPDVVHLGFRLAGLVRQEFAARMADERWAHDANLRPGCFGVLRVVAHADHPVSQRDVSEHTGIDASDVVDLVDRLERAGYVRRQRDERDRRRYALELTDEGHTAIERFHAVSRAVDDAILDTLDPGERATLRGLLRRVVEAAEPPSPRAQPVGRVG